MKNKVLLALTAVLACVGLAYAGTLSGFDTHNGDLRPQQPQEVTIGEGNELVRTPVDFYWHTSLYQVLYYASELPAEPHLISSIKLYNNFSSNDVMNKPLRIWLGNTHISSLADDWVPASQMSLVFDGVVSFPAGQNTITIPLDNDFQYSATNNLVMMVFRPMDDIHYSMSDKFKAQTDTHLRARYVASDSEVIDPASPPAVSNYTGQFPKTSFMMELNYNSIISGTVFNKEEEPLVGVQLILNGGEHETTTNQYGWFQFEGLDPGTYTILLRLQGYYDLVEHFTVDGIEELLLYFVMLEKPPANDDNIQAPQLLSVYPNPFKHGCTVSYEVRKAAPVKIAVYNIKGQLIEQLKDEPQSAGNYTLSFDGQNMPSGIYLIRMQIGGRNYTTRMLKL